MSFSIDDLTNTIRTTTAMVREYNSQETNRSKELLESIKGEEFHRALRELVRESFLLGPAGRACPRCNGTGRI